MRPDRHYSVLRASTINTRMPPQAEILRLINDLKEVYGNATIFITHDFGVVADVANRVAVMCWGKLIEEGPKEQILMHPKEP